jgi:hypothetical protein
MKNTKKAAIEMSFSWIFAITVGAIIILMAIYATTKFVQTSQYAQYTSGAKDIGNLLNPVVNGVTSAYSTHVDFKKNTRVYISCSTQSTNSPIFGRQIIAFSEESSFLKKWGAPGANLSRYNKYIFSNNIEEGKRFYIFSKPFYAGYRVDDLIYFTAKKYCFIGAPEEIKEELDSINPGNFNFSINVLNCKDSVNVCFGMLAAGCNMTVIPDTPEDYSSGQVRRQGESTLNFYSTPLMYAAIFSSPENYECNIKRLGNKINALGQIYKEEIEIVKSKNCNSAISPLIENIQRLSVNLTQFKIKEMYINAKDMDEQNCQSECQIYLPEKC